MAGSGEGDPHPEGHPLGRLCPAGSGGLWLTPLEWARATPASPWDPNRVTTLS